MIPHRTILTSGSLGVLQHADVAALVTHHIVALAGPQELPQVMAQLNTPVLLHSHILPTITRHHPFTPLLSQIKGTITKVTNKTKGILEVNSKALNYSSRETRMCRNAVESLSMHLLRVHRQERAAMESSDRRIQGEIGAKRML